MEIIAGQVAGQLSLLLAIPVLTRLLSIDQMGVYQTAFSIMLILQPVATLRRELLIPVSGLNDARRHRRTGLTVAGIFALTITSAAVVAWLMANGHLADILATSAIILFSFALVQIENAYLIRRGAHRRLAIRNFLAGVAAALLQTLAALIVPTALSVAIALLIGRALATAVTVTRLPLPDDTEASGGQRKSQRSFSAILSAVVAGASSQAIVLVSFGTLGASAAAQVGIGQRIGGAPASLVAQAMSQIALSTAAPLIRERRPGMTAALRSQTLITGAGAAVTAATLMIAGPILAVPVLGPGWREAGILTAVFAIPLSLTLVALPATTLLIPLGRERLLLTLQLLRLGAILLTLGLMSLATDDVIATCIVTAIVWTLAYAPLLTASFLSTRAHDRACA